MSDASGDEHASSVPEALARAITSLSSELRCEVELFEGRARFDASLVGPPGRLHGGLHIAARSFTVLRALDRHARLPACPIELDVALGKAIPLEEEVDFDGALVREGDVFSLETRFLGSTRLVATARSLTRFLAPTWLDEDLKTLIDRELAAVDAKHMRVFGVPFTLTAHTAFVELPLDAHVPSHDFTRLREADGRLGSTYVCAALDTVAAVGLGMLWGHHLFTTHASIVLDTLPLEHDEPLLLVVPLSLAAPVTGSAMASVRIGERLLSTTRVPVLLAKRQGLVPLAYGTFELHPVDLARFATGSKSPLEHIEG